MGNKLTTNLRKSFANNKNSYILCFYIIVRVCFMRIVCQYISFLNKIHFNIKYQNQSFAVYPQWNDFTELNSIDNQSQCMENISYKTRHKRLNRIKKIMILLYSENNLSSLHCTSVKMCKKNIICI